ncbi:MAG: hypothetical protein EB025_00555, partial [Chitinophagaceae bacterium]|nr:hypothetical protein [Chitinophagaceae bacterium]
MRLLLLISISLFCQFALFAQRTRQSTEQDLPLYRALSTFRQGRIEEGCQLLERISFQEPNLSLQNQDLEIQEFRYAKIVCQLLKADKNGEIDALQFLAETNVQSWKDRIRFYLGN